MLARMHQAGDENGTAADAWPDMRTCIRLVRQVLAEENSPTEEKESKTGTKFPSGINLPAKSGCWLVQAADLPRFRVTGRSQPLPDGAPFIFGAPAPDAEGGAVFQCPVQALRPRWAALADPPGTLCFRQRRAGRPDRKEQVGLHPAACGAIAPGVPHVPDSGIRGRSLESVRRLLCWPKIRWWTSGAGGHRRRRLPGWSAS